MKIKIVSKILTLFFSLFLVVCLQHCLLGAGTYSVYAVSAPQSDAAVDGEKVIDPNKTKPTENKFTQESDKLNQPVDISSLPGPSGTIFDVFNLVIRILAGIVSSIVLFKIVSSAFKAISGKEADITERNTIIMNSLVGLVIVLLSGLIATGTVNLFYGSGDSKAGTANLFAQMDFNPANNTALTKSGAKIPADILKIVNDSVSIKPAESEFYKLANGGHIDYTYVVTCSQIIYLKRIGPDTFYNPEFRAAYYPLLNKCGQQAITDVSFVIKQILSFLYNILGTLMVIALMIAGFQFIFDKKKDAEEGRKKLQNVFKGAIIALVAAPLLQIGFAAIMQLLG